MTIFLLINPLLKLKNILHSDLNKSFSLIHPILKLQNNPLKSFIFSFLKELACWDWGPVLIWIKVSSMRLRTYPYTNVHLFSSSPEQQYNNLKIVESYLLLLNKTRGHYFYDYIHSIKKRKEIFNIFYSVLVFFLLISIESYLNLVYWITVYSWGVLVFHVTRCCKTFQHRNHRKGKR